MRDLAQSSPIRLLFLHALARRFLAGDSHPNRRVLVQRLLLLPSRQKIGANKWPGQATRRLKTRTNTGRARLWTRAQKWSQIETREAPTRSERELLLPPWSRYAKLCQQFSLILPWRASSFPSSLSRFQYASACYLLYFSLTKRARICIMIQPANN